MTALRYVLLEDRGVLAISGEDRVAFLQGLVSNDVRNASESRAIYAALLTPQGKFLHDLFIVGLGDQLLVDCERERRDDLRQRLSRFRLRSKVKIEDATDAFAIAAVTGDGAAAALGIDSGELRGAASLAGDGIAYVDPRLACLGVRLILPRTESPSNLLRETQAGDIADYDRLRLSLGVPAGSRDLPIEKAFLLESGFDELAGVDWQKGCYMGQELTARTKYRGLVKKRLFPVTIDGPTPEPGTPVMLGGKPVGEMRSANRDLGLALLRLDAVAAAGDAGLTAGDARLHAKRPDWMNLTEAASAESA